MHHIKPIITNKTANTKLAKASVQTKSKKQASASSKHGKQAYQLICRRKSSHDENIDAIKAHTKQTEA